jgi:hypothetical protein
VGEIFHVEEVNLMFTFSQLDPLWASPIAFAVVALGLMFAWRGLHSGRDGHRALLGQQIDMLNRIEGFRLTVSGLVLIGVGTAVIWRAQWLLLLALGIGFVEILESSALIAVWKWDRRHGAPSPHRRGRPPDSLAAVPDLRST